MATSQPSDVMSAENKLIQDLLDFNQKYAAYASCANKYTTSDDNCNSLGQDVKTAYLILSQPTTGSIAKTSTEFQSLTGITPKQYDASYNHILNVQNSNIKMRQELDTKLQNLYETPDSMYADYKKSVDSSVYSGILWTVLATSVLYIVFTKL